MRPAAIASVTDGDDGRSVVNTTGIAVRSTSSRKPATESRSRPASDSSASNHIENGDPVTATASTAPESSRRPATETRLPASLSVAPIRSTGLSVDADCGTAPAISCAVSAGSTGTSSPAATTASDAITPLPPPVVITPTRRPRGAGRARSAATASAISRGVQTRTAPHAAHIASTTAESPTRAPVWDSAARAPAADRPGASSTTGLPASRSASAARPNARPSGNASQYTATARVCSCDTQSASTSATVTSAWLPTETKREKPSARSRARSPKSMLRLPDWETNATSPAGRSIHGAACRPLPVSTTPMQFGPSSTAPASCAARAIRRSTSRPASPVSPNPAAIATTARTPAPSTWSATSGSTRDGTTSTASSGTSGSPSSEDTVARPSTSGRRSLTK